MVKKLSRSEQRNRLKREAKRQGVSYDSLGKKKSNTSYTSNPVEDRGDGTLAVGITSFFLQVSKVEICANFSSNLLTQNGVFCQSLSKFMFLCRN